MKFNTPILVNPLTPIISNLSIGIVDFQFMEFHSRISYQDRFLAKISQNEILKIKITHFVRDHHHFISKDTKVSFEHFLGKNFTNLASMDLKLHNRYCHIDYYCLIFILQLSRKSRL